MKAKGLDKKVYSDIVDEDGNQYVDLVQEGGGVFGIALVGYSYIMEKAGIRFFSLAGTSAGAINTIMMAGLSKIGDPVSEKILDILGRQNLFDFVDGSKSIKKLVQRYADGKKGVLLLAVLNFFRIRKYLKSYYGLNPGYIFQGWVDENLEKAGIKTVADLTQHRKKVPKLLHRETNEEIHREAFLKIITSDVTTKSKITFPEMSELYWSDTDSVKPSCFVRASMSIPFFFYPFVIENIPDAGTTEDINLPKDKTRWWKHTGYRGVIPEKVLFVDGGMLSNFPINAFHRKGVPAKPTFGARLSTWRNEAQPIEKLKKFPGSMISTMRQLHDYDFLLKNDDYNKLICSIDCDAEEDENGKTRFNWLDFNMSEELKIELFELGAKKAFAFLDDFKWIEYRDARTLPG
ncbi:MAG: patatin-like phospholipase family protein [Ignavibacteriaceae bacterium]